MSSPQARTVVFVDTSVLIRLIGRDGDEAARQIAEELEARQAAGQQFVIPATAIVETGNLVAQQRSGRRRLAERLQSVLQEARSDNPPWSIRAAPSTQP